MCTLNLTLNSDICHQGADRGQDTEPIHYPGLLCDTNGSYLDWGPGHHLSRASGEDPGLSDHLQHAGLPRTLVSDHHHLGKVREEGGVSEMEGSMDRIKPTVIQEDGTGLVQCLAASYPG